MSTQPLIPEDIEGLPPGAILKPILRNQGIEGLPPGAVLKAIQQPSTQAATPASNEFDPAKAAANPILYGYQRVGHALVHGAGEFLKTLAGMVPNVAPGPGDILTGGAQALQGGAESFHKAGQEGQAAQQATSIPAAAAHRVGQVGYGATGLLAPLGGKVLEQAGEKIGTGDVSGGLGTTAAVLAPFGAAHIAPSSLRAPLKPAAEVQPAHVEALTSLIEDKAGTVDPHETASAALPTLRETAVRMKVDPSQMEGRAAGQATLKVVEQAVRDTQNEFNTIKKPYNAVLVDQKPIADAYRSAITPELLANEPKVARALEKQAQKFNQPAPLEQVNQFRTRMNNQLNAFEQRGTTAQIMSDIETKASKAAANAARDVEYSTVGRLSGLDPEYIRGLKQREGSLIEAKTSLEKEYNRASGQQGEAASKTLREKVANTYPSPRGIKHVGIKELIGPKPIDALNLRFKKMFEGMGPASELPSYEQVQPPAGPQGKGGPSGPLPSGEAPRGVKAPQQRTFLRTTKADVKDYYNYRFDQLREELKGAETPEAKADVQRRMAELDQTQRFHPTSEGGQVKPPVAPVVENGQITQAHVDAENAFYTQARAELGAQADPMAVLRRAQALKVEHVAKGAPLPTTPVPPTVRPTLTQKMQAQPLPSLRRIQAPVKASGGPSEAAAALSPGERATALMLLVKQGKMSAEEADSKIQRLVGSGGRRLIRRPAAPE